jgi:hypothetical protein
MIEIFSTEKDLEKEIIVTKEKSDKNFIQLINFLSQEPPTPVDWSFFESKEKENVSKKVVDNYKKL